MAKMTKIYRFTAQCQEGGCFVMVKAVYCNVKTHWSHHLSWTTVMVYCIALLPHFGYSGNTVRETNNNLVYGLFHSVALSAGNWLTTTWFILQLMRHGNAQQSIITAKPLQSGHIAAGPWVLSSVNTPVPSPTCSVSLPVFVPRTDPTPLSVDSWSLETGPTQTQVPWRTA